MQLLRDGHEVCRNTVASLMRANKLSPKRKRKFVSTTDSKHNLPLKQNVLNREFAQSKAHNVWVSDITYIDTKDGWLYLAVFIEINGFK